MRKYLGLIALLFALIVASSARADTLYTYTYTLNLGAGGEESFTTQPLGPGDLGLDLFPTTLLGDSNAAPLGAGGSFNYYVLDSGGTGALIVNFSPGASISDSFAVADYTTPGTYNGVIAGAIVDTLVVSAVQVPEPSIAGLVLVGIGFLLVMRKRKDQGLRQAT